MPTDIPYAPVRSYSFGDVLREHRRSRPRLLAAIEVGTSITYAELNARVNKVADALRKRGVGSGDRLLWIGQNSMKVTELMLVAAKLGAILCPANWRLAGNELKFLIADFSPKIVFWQDAEIGELRRDEMDKLLGTFQRVQHDGHGPGSYEALLEEGEDIDPFLSVSEADTVLAVYTAAFEGRPNAALLSHSALIFQSLLSAHGQAINDRSRHLVSRSDVSRRRTSGGFGNTAFRWMQHLRRPGTG